MKKIIEVLKAERETILKSEKNFAFTEALAAAEKVQRINDALNTMEGLRQDIKPAGPEN